MKRLLCITLLVFAAWPTEGVAQAPVLADDIDTVWTCPLHREVTEAEAGTCHICDRALIQTLVQRAWSCPIHAVISDDEPGTCPICGRDLFLITEEIRFACPMHPEVESHEEGSCPICKMDLVAETQARPHQDHNPKHGGMFFMAPDNWHHLEGTYPEPGVFRVFVFNNFSEALNAKDFKGRAVLKETFDPDTKTTRELIAYPLLPSPDGAYLEAHVGSSDLPREVTAKVRFERDGEFERFDFIFADLSLDVATPATATEAATGELVVPGTATGIVAAIVERSVSVRELVTGGALGEIYLPALEAKDLAVALERHIGTRSVADQKTLTWALKQLVRSAWLLDDYGDLGNREKVYEAHDMFTEAVEQLQGLYP